MRLGELLKEAGIINRQQLEHALAEQEKRQARLGEVLIDLGYITETALTYALGEQLGIRVIPAARLEPDVSLVKLFPISVLEEHLFLPLSMKEERVEVAVFDPFEDITQMAVRFFTNSEPRLLLSTRSAIISALKTLKRSLPLTPVNAPHDATAWLRLPGQTLPQMVAEIIARAAACQASAIHLDLEGGSLRIRLRMGRQLMEAAEWPAILAQPLSHLLQMPAGWPVPEPPAPFRTTVIQTRSGVKMTLKLGQTTPQAAGLRALELDEVTTSRLERILSLAHGLLLITGPSNTERTLALSRCAAHLATMGRDTLLVSEDPLPSMKGVAQVPASPSPELVSGLAGLDPDAILLDVIRDSRTLVQASRVALSGHLVIASVPAEDLASLWRRIGLMGCDANDVIIATRAVLHCSGDPNQPRSLITF